MKGIFIELPMFERYLSEYLDDEGYRQLQDTMMRNPASGDLIEGTGGLRKLRYGDKRRGKGKRGGLRVIYYYWITGPQFWMFALYDKNEMSDLTPKQRARLKEWLKLELRRGET